jgi:hypothetical protein
VVARIMAKDLERWERVIKAAGVKPEQASPWAVV